MNTVDSYLEDKLPAMKASDFLKTVSHIKTFCDLTKDLKEERKEQEDFVWLFKETDSKLVDMKTELALIESWFPGKKIFLEKLYSGSGNGFNGNAYHAKCNHTSHIFTVVESEHGKKFGSYSSVPFDSSNKYY